MNDAAQRDLFPEESLPPDLDSKHPPISSEASIQAALGVFETHMRDEGFLYQHHEGFLK